MTLLRRSHFFDSLRQVLLFLVLLDLHMHRCNSHRVSVENYVSLRQGLMRDGPSPSPNNTWPSKMPGTPSARYTILITATLVLLLACALGMHFMIKCALTCSLRRRDGSAGAERAAPKQAEESKIELALLPVAVYGKLPWRPAAAAPLVSSPPPPLPATPPPPTTASTPFPTDSQCAICLNEFRHGEKMRVLPLCGHGFHVCCIDAWLAAHTSCPMCRFDLNTLVGLRSQKISKSHISSYLTNPLFQW